MNCVALLEYFVSMSTSSDSISNNNSSDSFSVSDLYSSSTDTVDLSSSSDDYAFQFLLRSYEGMLCENSFSSASQLPFWWLAEEVAGLQSLVVTTNVPLPF